MSVDDQERMIRRAQRREDRRYERSLITPPTVQKTIDRNVGVHDLQDFTGLGIQQVRDGFRGPKLADYGELRDNILTGGVIGRYGLLAGRQSQTLIQISGPDETAEVISFALVSPYVANGQQSGQPSIDVDFYAQIDFGIGGADSQFELDYTRGQVVSLPASYLRIQAVNATFDPTVFNFGAMVSLRQLGSGLPPRRTIRVITEPGNESAIAAIPRYAQKMKVQRDFSVSGSPFQVNWYGEDGTTLRASNNVGAFQTMDDTWIDGNSGFFTIVDNNAPSELRPTDRYYAIFELAV